MEVIRVHQTIQKQGELLIRNLPVEKGQQVEVLLLYTSPDTPRRQRMTARQLLRSNLVGLWKERQDIIDGPSYARQIREKAQNRVTGRIADDNPGQ